MAAIAPGSGAIFFVWMKRAMFSITTIASSTTSPVANVSPNIVNVLIENPRTCMIANVPTSDTGIVMTGTSVVRGSCKKTNTTRTTSTIESASVIKTSLRDSVTKSVASKAIFALTPGGKLWAKPAIAARTALATSRALAVGSAWTPMPTAVLRSKRTICE